MSAQGYNNDQFYGLWRSEGQDGRPNWYQTSKPDNPPFIYPSRSVRTQDSDGKMSNKTMQRGYIRTLLSSAQGQQLHIRKCGFQFNPDVLHTNVTMASDTLNAMQLDLSNLAVPMLGNSNFGFDLFFDRSMELNNAGNGKGLDGNTSGNLFTASDPGEIGVFRDIGELCAIIGAGISPETLKFADASQRRIAGAQSAADTITDQAVKKTQYDKALQGISTIVSSANYGNSAFLIPNPVRVVFSSLFMVEGYVSNIDIQYVKFTTNMVPMMAKVTISMSAVYIGYAKAKTFTTMALEDAEHAYQDEQNALQAAQNALALDLGVAMSSVYVYAAAPKSSGSGQHGPAKYISEMILGMPYVVGVSMDDVTSSLPSTADATSPAMFDISTKFEMWGPYSSDKSWKASDTPRWVGNDNNTGIEWSKIPEGWFCSETLGTTYSTTPTGTFVYRFSVKITCTFTGSTITGTGSRLLTVVNPSNNPVDPMNLAGLNISIYWAGAPVPDAVPVSPMGSSFDRNTIPAGAPKPAEPGTSSPVATPRFYRPVAPPATKVKPDNTPVKAV